MLAATFEVLASELRARADPPHVARTVPIELFVADTASDAHGGSPPEGPTSQPDHQTDSPQGPVRLCRAFLLRRGARMAVPERHGNSVQRLVSFRGSGCIHQGVSGGGPQNLRPRAICSPDAHRDSLDAADLRHHWDIVPSGVWHFPEASKDGDWATVTFHSAGEHDIVDEYWDEE